MLQAPAAPAAAPDLHHLALALDHLEAGDRGGLGDHHVNRVGADVDGGDSHPWVSSLLRPVPSKCEAEGRSRQDGHTTVTCFSRSFMWRTLPRPRPTSSLPS